MKMPFEKWRETFTKLQEPLHEMAVLNIKTLESLTYLKPENLKDINNPEKLVNMQINIAFSNAHRLLDYIQGSFQIMEQVVLSVIPEAKRNQKQK